MQDKHKRSRNIKNLQIPKVDEQIWRQLRPKTKAYDYAIQKCQQEIATALVPSIKALQLLKEKEPNVQQLREFVGDIFKSLANTITTTNQTRMDKITRDLLPTYKPICEYTPSATHLFGDRLQKKLNKLTEQKTQLTTIKSTTTSRGHF
ncbi:hypothetical protein DPMN_082674 [Dreissena polymorpha]|uniref:Uncharacterized protein n=1 Tax=Dreissena polymorpha TaxID=45954 RepID=A0A9D3Y8I5_DREPO|nr:hypothetical protein DPMN_082674 [Dreissena polymorpha]